MLRDMRVMDLDYDMSDVIPTGTSIDSEFLFRQMEDATFAALHCRPGSRVLDSAAGIGQDDRVLANRGAWAVGAEPSKRMIGLAQLTDGDHPEVKSPGALLRVRAWSESLPFAQGSFDGAFCKGALDHFDDPGRCIRELARVTSSDGRVVLAVANFGSLGCRIARLRHRLRRVLSRSGRRHFDVPSDHFTRYNARLLREQSSQFIRIDEWTGVSLLWGVQTWGTLLARLPERWAQRLLEFSGQVARRFPSLADVIVVAGPPRLGT